MSFGRVQANVEKLKDILSRFEQGSWTIDIIAHNNIRIRAHGQPRYFLQVQVPHKYLKDVFVSNGVVVSDWLVPYELFDRNLDSQQRKE